MLVFQNQFRAPRTVAISACHLSLWRVFFAQKGLPLVRRSALKLFQDNSFGLNVTPTVDS